MLVVIVRHKTHASSLLAILNYTQSVASGLKRAHHTANCNTCPWRQNSCRRLQSILESYANRIFAKVRYQVLLWRFIFNLGDSCASFSFSDWGISFAFVIRSVLVQEQKKSLVETNFTLSSSKNMKIRTLKSDRTELFQQVCFVTDMSKSARQPWGKTLGKFAF